MTTPEEAALLDRLWGVAEPQPVEVALGPWRFELRGDEVADLAYDGTAVLRSVRAVVRDRDWNTVPAVVEAIERFEGGCRLRLALRGFGADVTAILTVAAEADRIDVSLEATSHAEFLSNRLGLVVLHPPAVAGAPLVVGTPSGLERRTSFPDTVSPHQPATDIRSLAWKHDGVAARVEFAGEVFEMEDQRNWTDASFKTYSTPLALPFPVRIEPGAVIAQSVSIGAERIAGRPAVAASAPDPVILEPVGRPVPEVVLGASSVPDVASATSTDALASATPHPAGVAAILVELDTRTPQWRAALLRARDEAGGLPLDVRIIADEPDRVTDAVDAVAAPPAGPIARLGVFSARTHVTEPALWAALVDASARVPGAELLGGARSHFTELNREHHRLPRDLPALAFSMTPQMHATERTQLVESVPMQAVVTRDAGRIAAGRPLHVGPVTLRSRFNAVATSPPDKGGDPTLAGGYGAELVAGATDLRQSSAALEAWTVASYASVATAPDAAVGSIAYFETRGPRGIRHDDHPYPVARAIARVAGLRGGELLAPRGACPPGVFVVGARFDDGSWRVLVTSLATEPVALDVIVDERRRAVEVAPFDVVVIDLDGT